MFSRYFILVWNLGIPSAYIQSIDWIYPLGEEIAMEKSTSFCFTKKKAVISAICRSKFLRKNPSQWSFKGAMEGALLARCLSSLIVSFESFWALVTSTRSSFSFVKGRFSFEQTAFSCCNNFCSSCCCSSPFLLPSFVSKEEAFTRASSKSVLWLCVRSLALEEIISTDETRCVPPLRLMSKVPLGVGTGMHAGPQCVKARTFEQSFRNRQLGPFPINGACDWALFQHQSLFFAGLWRYPANAETQALEAALAGTPAFGISKVGHRKNGQLWLESSPGANSRQIKCPFIW